MPRRQRFLAEDIERRMRQMAVVERLQERRIVDERPAPGIDDAGPAGQPRNWARMRSLFIPRGTDHEMRAVTETRHIALLSRRSLWA